MPSRTSIFQMLPWVGGLNTALDEALIPPNQCTVLDNVLFDTRGSKKKRPAINHAWDGAASGTTNIIGLHDYWYFDGTNMVQKLVGVASDGAVYSYDPDTGTRTTLALDAGATAWTGTLTSCSMLTFNNKLFIAVSGSANVIRMWDPQTSASLFDCPGTPPKASILRAHLGRMWCNDKANRDRAHYSPTADHTQWNGADDSGAIDIGLGDGDPEGITAIFPTFKGDTFIAKRSKFYRVAGYAPETFQVSLISSGVGCVSHNSVAPIDQDDIMWVSEKGVHALSATANFGDFESSFVSNDIQRTFNEDLSVSRLKYSWAAYLPNINSVAFCFTESSGLNRSLTTTTVNNAVYLYNVPLKAWYRWPDVSCQSVVVASDSDKKRFYFGTHTTRVSKTFHSTNYDISAAGASVAIRFKVVTGIIYPDQSPYAMKGFKRFILFYKPQGNHTITAALKVDNFGLNSENSLSFSETTSSALLGSTFTLGTSSLGYDVVLGPYTRHIDGVGRGVKLTLEQTGTDQEVEIQGFAVEFESAGTSPEVFLS